MTPKTLEEGKSGNECARCGAAVSEMDDCGLIGCPMHDADYDCPTCKGTGYVNPLTAPDDFLCLATTDCPHCDGTGVF